MTDQTTDIGDNPGASPSTPKLRKRRGIGDNSKSNPNRDQEKVSLETISQHLSFALVKASEYDAAWTSRTAEVESKGAETIVAIYVVCREIHTAGAYDQFTASYGISAHGNARNPWHPIVNLCFLKLPCAYAKSTLSKWSTIVNYGVVSGLAVQQFADLVRASGIENLYKQFKPSARKDGMTELQHEELAKALLPDRTDAPVFSDPKILGGNSGNRLAVVEGDGAGNFRLLKMLDHSPQEVTHLLSAIARKKLAQ